MGSSDLTGRTVLVQGIGNVGRNLVKYLKEEDVDVIINDINEKQLIEVSEQYSTRVFSGDKIYDMDIDIYAPCALGSTLNPNTISSLKCAIVAGAANNQLADEERDGKLLSEKGIIYAPDFLINAGGLINVYSEIKGFSPEEVINQTKNIYNTTLEIFNKAKKDDVTTHFAALQIAKKIISRKKETIL